MVTVKGKAKAGAGWRAGAMPAGAAAPAGTTRTAAGAAAEALALAWLQQRGLALVQRNYRVARGPGARGGEIDLILREPDGTLVFCEVRARRDTGHGGAAASVGAAKQRSLIYAARHFLMRLDTLPPCRFDVLAIDGSQVEWLQAAFDGAG